MVWLGNPSNESENIALAHDQIVFTIHLDLGATVFRDQDFVADFDVLDQDPNPGMRVVTIDVEPPRQRA
jgi:hypothetical protein